MLDNLKNIGSYLSEYGLRIALSVCVVALAVVLCWLLTFLLKKLLHRSKIDDASISFIIAIFKIVFTIITLLICASIFDLSTSSLVVSLSTLALAVALALKDSLANLANGILIIINKPFRRGDYVSVGGIEGKVQSIRLLTVELISFDNSRIILPNASIVNGNIYNYSALPIRRVDMSFSVAYGSDMDLVEQTLREVCLSQEKVLKSIDPVIFLASHDASAITFSVRVWTNTVDYFAVKNAFPRLVYDAFCRENICIPFNQLDVHIQRESEGR